MSRIYVTSLHICFYDLVKVSSSDLSAITLRFIAIIMNPSANAFVPAAEVNARINLSEIKVNRPRGSVNPEAVAFVPAAERAALQRISDLEREISTLSGSVEALQVSSIN